MRRWAFLPPLAAVIAGAMTVTWIPSPKHAAGLVAADDPAAPRPTPPTPTAQAADPAPPLRGVLAPGPAAAACLPKAKHWSELPTLPPASVIVWSAYIRFTTADGEVYPARVFLLESHFGGKDRVIGIGHEIEVDHAYDPEFEVDAGHVKPQAACRFLVSLGSLECFVHTTEH